MVLCVLLSFCQVGLCYPLTSPSIAFRLPCPFGNNHLHNLEAVMLLKNFLEFLLASRCPPELQGFGRGLDLPLLVGTRAVATKPWCCLELLTLTHLSKQ